MLSRLNEFFKGWISFVIICVISFTFVLWGLDSYIHNALHSDVVASVNHTDIHKHQLQTAFERARLQYEQMVGKPLNENTDIQSLRNETLKNLIEREALSQFATQLGLSVSPSQTETMLMSIPAFQADGQFSVERFQRALAAMQYSQSHFLEELQTDLVLNQLRTGITNTAFALPSEINQTVRLVNQKRDIDYIILDRALFKNKVRIQEEAILSYYNDHKNDFETPLKVKISYLLLDLNDLVKKAKVTEQEISDYYNNHKANFVKPTKWQVAHILLKLPENASPEVVATKEKLMSDIAKKLKSGNVKFEDLAKQYSDDILSAKEGGVLPWLHKGMTDQSFEKIFSPLKQVGEVSQPARSRYGFELVKLIGYQPEKSQPLSDVSRQIEQTLKQDKAQKQFGNLREELANQTFSNPDSLDTAAQTLGLSLHTSDYISKNEPGAGITANPDVIRAAFSSDVLQGNNSDVIAIKEGQVLVLRVSDSQSAQMQPLKAVSDRVRQILVEKAEMQASSELATQLASASPAKAEALNKEFNLRWIHEKSVGRQNRNLLPSIVTAAFELAEPTAPISISSKVVEVPNQGYAVVKLNKVISELKNPMDEEQRTLIRDHIANSDGALSYDLLTKDILANSKIKNNLDSVMPSDTRD